MEQTQESVEGLTPMEEILELVARIETAGETLDGTDSEYFEKKDLDRLLVAIASLKRKTERTVTVLDGDAPETTVSAHQEGVFFVTYREGERGRASYQSFTVWAESEAEAISLTSEQIKQTGKFPPVFDQIERCEKGIIDCCTFSD